LPAWQIAYDASTIAFTGEQAGAPFTGSFSSWQADIRFDPEHLDQSTASVTIELASVDTQDTERDKTLAEAQWFAAGLAQFHASEFRSREAEGFTTTNATLAFASVARPVDFRFTIKQIEGRTILQGHARLDRLDLGVGTGDWTDTTWVGQFVDVEIRVVTMQQTTNSRGEL
jgi:polyisoprenoid-binding protein YceI